MRNDSDVRRDVVAELGRDPALRDLAISVAVADGVVTLGGAVGSWETRQEAARAVERVPGVRAVADEIAVGLPDARDVDDTELAHRVVDALALHIQVPDDRVTARVEHGWVTLDGVVEWEYQRRATHRTVRDLRGVRGVTDRLVLRPRATPLDVSHRIRDALRRQAERDAAAIGVEVEGDTVTLRGTVHSWSERHEAESAAWGAPGVTRVEDRIAVQV